MLGKAFGKANKKFSKVEFLAHVNNCLKELETSKKKQAKDTGNVVKSQCGAIEKAAKGKSFKTTEEVCSIILF